MNTRFQTKGRSTPGHGDQTPSIVRGVIETDAVSESRWVKAVLTRRHATALSTKPESSARKMVAGRPAAHSEALIRWSRRA
jgi:hypothetical protein